MDRRKINAGIHFRNQLLTCVMSGNKNKYGAAPKESGLSKAWKATKDDMNWEEMKMGKNCHPENCPARYNASETIYGKVANVVQYGIVNSKKCDNMCTYPQRVEYAKEHGTSVPRDVPRSSGAFSKQPWVAKK